MTTFQSRSRRDFLRHFACTGLAAAGAASMFSQLRLINSALAAPLACPGYPPVSDYKALVCIFLFGGNDSFNLLVPYDMPRYSLYNTWRGDLAIAHADLSQIPVNGSPGSYAVPTTFYDSAFGLADVLANGHGAFVTNTGTLVEPITKSQYLDPNRTQQIPPQLFSHADQQAQWQYGQPTENGTVGWGGLMADRLHVLNDGATIPISISLAGQNRFQAGATIQPYVMTAAGATQLAGFSNGAKSALQDLVAQAYPDALTQTYASTFDNAIDYAAAMQTALASAPPLQTVFPDDNPLGDALKMIAQIISVRSQLSAKRQIFFASMGGFDTHSGQLNDQPLLLGGLAQALGAFYAATRELNVANSVTAFTASEFARTLNSNGDGADAGSDHAWGGNQFVMGGSVRGKALYGTFPDLNNPSNDGLSRGQMVPTISCDQYSATFARWLGVNDCDLATIFPFAHNFGATAYDLGFLG